MSDKESYQEKIDRTHYGGQSTTLARGEACLRDVLQPTAVRPEILIENVSKTQTVHTPNETHAGITREIICGFVGCSEVVVATTEFNDEGKEVVTGYSNPRVSQPLANCGRRARTVSL